jgi:translation initiation factor 2B subunit (eIF-2B alpha/beta/delta family)
MDLLINKTINDNKYNRIENQILDRFSDMGIFTYVLQNLDRNHLKESANKIKKEILESSEIIKSNFKKYMGSKTKLLTFSNSQLIEEVLKTVNCEKYSMISEPGKEGKILSNKINSFLLQDEEALDRLSNKEFNYVIISCDQYSETEIVNKIGTKKLLQYCNDNQVPCLLLASKFKRTNSIIKPQNPLLEIISLEDFKDMIILVGDF